jgi:hypothetical protein
MRKYTMNFTLHVPVKPYEMRLMDIFKIFLPEEYINVQSVSICKQNNCFTTQS